MYEVHFSRIIKVLEATIKDGKMTIQKIEVEDEGIFARVPLPFPFTKEVNEAIEKEIHKKHRKHQEQIMSNIMRPAMLKQCRICKKRKEKTEFNKDKSSKDGLTNICKECNRQRCKEWAIKQKKMAISITTKEIPKTLICAKCGIEKPITEYHKSKQGTFGVKKQCKTCCNEYLEKYRVRKHISMVNMNKGDTQSNWEKFKGKFK